MLQKDQAAAHEEMSKLSSFRAFSDMLVALTHNNGDGRIIVSGQQGGYIKYVMLTGAKLFSEVGPFINPFLSFQVRNVSLFLELINVEVN